MYTSGVARGKTRGRSVPGSKINPLESMIISDIMLKSKNKAANSGCNNTKIFETTRNTTKYILTLYRKISIRKMLTPNKKGRQKIWGK